MEEKSSRIVNRCIFIVCCLMCVYGLSCYEIFSSRSTPFFTRIASSKAKFTISDAWPRRSVADAAPAMLLKWVFGARRMKVHAKSQIQFISPKKVKSTRVRNGKMTLTCDCGANKREREEIGWRGGRKPRCSATHKFLEKWQFLVSIAVPVTDVTS